MPLIQPSRRFFAAQHHLLPLLQAAACNSYDPSNAAVAAQRDAGGEDGKADVTVDGAQAAKSSPVTAGSSQWKASAARLFNLKTNGQSRVEVTTVNLSAQGNIPDGRFYYSYPNANNPNIPQSQWYTTKLKIALRGFVNASGSASVALDSRTVTIVGSIGQSFQKSPSPEPVAAGMPTPASIPGYNPPMWRVPVKPQSDGSWIVDSSAQWSSHGAQMDLTPQWVGPVGVYANASNFSTRTYLWTISGGTPIIDPPQTDPDFLKRDTITFGSSQPDTGVAASRRLQLSTKNDDSDFTQATTFNVTVTDADGTVGKALPYGVIWHVPYEWNTSQKAMSHWESAEAISVPVPEANWQGSIQGNWKWKTMSAGELPTAQDYYIDATKEATGTITDALGVSADKTVDGAIDSVKDVRLHLMLKLGKKLGQTYAGDLMEQWAPSDQTRNASFQSMWALTSSDPKFPHSDWVDTAGNSVNRPDVDWNLIQNGPYPNDPNKQAAFDANLKIAQPWKVKDPVLRVNKDRYLYRGDGYDGHGFTGACYGAIDVFKPEPFVTGTFVTSASTLTPTLAPAG